MIKRSFLLLSVVIIAFVSCGENNDDESTDFENPTQSQSGNQQGTSQSESTGGVSQGNLIKEIIMTAPREGTRRYSFSYDDSGNLMKIKLEYAGDTYGRKSSYVTLKKNNTKSVIITSRSSPMDLPGEEEIPLNSKGYISQLFQNSGFPVIVIYGHNSNDYFMGKESSNSHHIEKWTYSDGCLRGVEYSTDNTLFKQNYSYEMGNELNNANIDLNYFISYYGRIGHGNYVGLLDDYTREGSLFLFGLLGKKSKNIISGENYKEQNNGLTKEEQQQTYNYRVFRDGKERIKEIKYNFKGYYVMLEKTNKNSNNYTEKRTDYEGEADVLIFYEKSNWPNKPY